MSLSTTQLSLEYEPDEQVAPMPMIPLGEIAEVKLGKMLDKSKHKTGRKLSYLRNINVRWGTVDTSDLLEMYFKERELDRFSIKNGDVLVCEGGEPGRAAVWTKGDTEIKFQKALHRVRFQSEYEPRLLVYYLEWMATRGGLERLFTGSTIKHFTRQSFVRLPVPNCSLPEQRRIVSKIEELFSKLDAGVAALKQAKAQLKRYRQSVLAAAVTGELTKEWRANNPNTEPASQLLDRILKQRHDQWYGRGKYSEPSAPQKLAFQLPSDSWAHVSIDQLSIDTTIGLVRSASLQNTNGIGTAYLKMDKVDMDGGISLEGLVYVDATKEEIKRFALRKSDVLFNTRNSVELVGKTGYLNSDPEFPIVYNNNLMRIRFIEAALPAFVALQMCSKPFRAKMKGAKRATTSVAAIYGKDLRPLPIALPPLEEQKQIIAEVEARTTTIDHIETELDQQLTRANRLRQSILSSAFSGKL